MPLICLCLLPGETAGRATTIVPPPSTSNAAIDSRTTHYVDMSYVGHKPAPCMHYECYPWDYAECDEGAHAVDANPTIIQTNGETAMITITKQDVYESVTNLCDYYFNGQRITGWVVTDSGIDIITNNTQSHHLNWPCVVETSPMVREVQEPPTEEVVQKHITKVKGDNRPYMPMTTIRVTGRFCEGYGPGVEGVVIDSPHLFLIGKTVKVDGRHKYINQYAS